MSNEKPNMRDLKSLNIENLFGIGNSKPHTNGKLDINTLFRKKTNNVDYAFDSDILLNSVRKRKSKLSETYANIYKGCCEIITNASNAGVTDIFFEVPENVIECTDYVSHDCLKFIKDKLSNQHISTKILSKKKIFITWHDLEEKMAQREEELKKLEDIDTTRFSHLSNGSHLSPNENVNENYDKYTNY